MSPQRQFAFLRIMWELEKEEMAQFIIASHSPILISYYLDSLHNGKGYMTEAAKLAVRFAFSELNLHRIEAGVMPHNIGSMRVLEKVGFHKEGIARKNVNLLNITLL